MDLKINILAILIAVVINVILGFLWYGLLFSRAWLKEMNYDPDMSPGKKAMAKGIALMIIGNFLFAWVLAFYLAGWEYIPDVKEMSSWSLAINSALSVWIGFLYLCT